MCVCLAVLGCELVSSYLGALMLNTQATSSFSSCCLNLYPNVTFSEKFCMTILSKISPTLLLFFSSAFPCNYNVYYLYMVGLSSTTM